MEMTSVCSPYERRIAVFIPGLETGTLFDQESHNAEVHSAFVTVTDGLKDGLCL